MQPPAFNSHQETESMLKGNNREAIYDAVSGIGAIPALEELDVSSVKLAWCSGWLDAAGWDVFDVFRLFRTTLPDMAGSISP